MEASGEFTLTEVVSAAAAAVVHVAERFCVPGHLTPPSRVILALYKDTDDVAFSRTFADGSAAIVLGHNAVYLTLSTARMIGASDQLRVAEFGLPGRVVAMMRGLRHERRLRRLVRDDGLDPLAALGELSHPEPLAAVIRLVILQSMTGTPLDALPDATSPKHRKTSSTALVMAAFAVAFIFAHEYAHALLGHHGHLANDPSSTGSTPTTDELAADSLGLQLILALASEADLRDLLPVAAYLAVTISTMYDDQILIHLGLTHPDAGRRIDGLEAAMSREGIDRLLTIRTFVMLYLTPLGLGGSLEQPLERVHWDALLRDAALLSALQAAGIDLQKLTRIDEMQRAGVADLQRRLVARLPQLPTGSAATLSEVLAFLGLDPIARSRVLDQTAPLRFGVLVNDVDGAPALAEFDSEGDRRDTAIMTALWIRALEKGRRG